MPRHSSLTDGIDKGFRDTSRQLLSKTLTAVEGFFISINEVECYKCPA